MDYKVPKKVLKLLDEGLLYHKSGRFDEAIGLYNKVLRKIPLQPDALWLKALVLMEFSEFQESIELLIIASKKRPKDAQITNDLGIVYEKVVNRDLVFKLFKNALDLSINLPSANINIARFQLENSNYIEALDKINFALELDSNIAEAYNIRGLILDKINDYDEALKSFSLGLALKSNNPEILINKSSLLCKMGLIDKALSYIIRAEELLDYTSNYWLHFLLTYGLILQKKDDLLLAKKKYDEVINLDANNFETLVNRAEINHLLNNIEDAYKDYKSALSIKKGSPDVNYNFSRLLLSNSDFKDGWEKYESRWGTDQFLDQYRGGSLVQWDGEVCENLSLFLWGEQGLGDQILFLSQLNDLLSMNIHPTIEVDPRLVKIVSNSFKDIDVYGYGEIPRDTSKKFDAQISFGSLGNIIYKDRPYKVSRLPFIKSDSIRTENYKKKYTNLKDNRLLIGISWNSINPNFGYKKSLPLKKWLPLLRVNEASFISLQYGNAVNEIEEIKKSDQLDIYNDSDLDQVLDLDGALSQIDSMDLVITTSNTTAHLAGALGKPTYVMVPKVPEWRWGLNGSESVWYQSVKIFRQKKTGIWEDVIEDVFSELKYFIDMHQN